CVVLDLFCFYCLHENLVFFFQAEDGIRDFHVTGVQTCALPIYAGRCRARRCALVRHERARTALSGSPAGKRASGRRIRDAGAHHAARRGSRKGALDERYRIRARSRVAAASAQRRRVRVRARRHGRHAGRGGRERHTDRRPDVSRAADRYPRRLAQREQHGAGQIPRDPRQGGRRARHGAGNVRGDPGARQRLSTGTPGTARTRQGPSPGIFSGTARAPTMSSSTWKAFVAVGLAAAFASGCCCHRIPLLSPVLIGGPPFEPHVQQEAGKAVVYLYWWIPDIGEADGWAILPMYGRVRHLYYYVNGRKTAPFVMGGYSVVEGPPGTIEVEIAADPNEVDPTLLRLGRPLWFARLTFRAEADQNYYVWAH